MSVKIWAIWFLLALPLLGSQSKMQEEGSDKVAYEALPFAVRAAAEAILGPQRIGKLDAEREVEEGTTLYEVGSSLEGRELSLKFTASGDLVEAERKVDFSELPEAVQQELSLAFPNQSFGEIEQVERHYFALEFQTDGREYEIQVSPAGQIQRVGRETQD